jgi:hypothetical protein
MCRTGCSLISEKREVRELMGENLSRCFPFFFLFCDMKKGPIMGACRNSFLGVFLLFLARIAFQSSFFSESRSFTKPLFCCFVPNLDRLAGQPIQIFVFFSFCSI